MLRKIVFTAVIVFTLIGITSAQYCPAPTGSRNGDLSSNYFNTGAISGLNRFVYDFAFTLDRGFRSGELTSHEVFVLENDLDQLKRRIERAYFDGRLSSSEWTFIEFDIRNIQRDLAREWNDNQRRLS